MQGLQTRAAPRPGESSGHPIALPFLVLSLVEEKITFLACLLACLPASARPPARSPVRSPARQPGLPNKSTVGLSQSLQYTISKHAVVGLTVQAAVEYGRCVPAAPRVPPSIPSLSVLPPPSPSIPRPHSRSAFSRIIPGDRAHNRGLSVPTQWFAHGASHADRFGIRVNTLSPGCVAPHSVGTLPVPLCLLNKGPHVRTWRLRGLYAQIRGPY